jgi:hypothetical protein
MKPCVNLVLKRPRQLTILEAGHRDLSKRARDGLAHGLRERHIDGIEPIVVDWIEREDDEETRGNLVHYLAAHSEVAGQYREMSLQIFSEAAALSETRTNMLAASEGTPLYGELRKLQIQQQEPNLLALMGGNGDQTMTKKNHYIRQ